MFGLLGKIYKNLLDGNAMQRSMKNQFIYN